MEKKKCKCKGKLVFSSKASYVVSIITTALFIITRIELFSVVALIFVWLPVVFEQEQG